MSKPSTAPENVDLSANARDLAGLVEYHEGSVVSRTLVKKPTGTVTLFAFAEGESLSEHTAPFDALVHVLDGQAEIAIQGKPFHVTAGQILLLPANKPHALKAITSFKMLLVMIRSEEGPGA